MRTSVLALGLGLSLSLGVESVCAAAPAGTSPQPVANAQTLSPAYPTCPPGKVVSKDDSDEAHYRYKAGKLEYDEANYSTAITRFLAAYNLDCTKHELLVIISRSFDLADNKAEAIRALELYLERANVTAVEATSIRARIANMRKQLAEKPATPPPTATTPPPGATASTAPPPPPPPATETREHTVYPWLVVGTGGLALATGLVVYVVGTQTLPDNCNASDEKCTEPLPPAGETKEQADRREAQEKATLERAGKAKGLKTGGVISLVGGGVLVAGGLLWHFLEPTGPVTKQGRPRPTLTPALSPGYAGLEIGGRF